MEVNLYVAMAVTGFFSALGGGIAQIMIKLYIEPKINKLTEQKVAA